MKTVVGVIRDFLNLFRENKNLSEYLGKYYITNTTIEKDIFKATDASYGKNSEIILTADRYFILGPGKNIYLTEDPCRYNLSEISEISPEKLSEIKATALKNLSEFFE